MVLAELEPRKGFCDTDEQHSLGLPRVHERDINLLHAMRVSDCADAYITGGHMAKDQALERTRRDFIPANVQEIVGTPDNLQLPTAVLNPDIAGIKPTVPEHLPILNGIVE